MGKDIEAINPATGEKIRTYETATDKQISSTFSKARDAFKQWKDLSIDKRCGYLRNLRKEIVERKEELVEAIKLDTGKPDVEVLMSDVLATLTMIKYYEENTEKILKTEKRKTPLEYPKHSSYVDYIPMGVVAMISPWNYPFQLSVVPAITALAAGNTVVLKPSEITPITGEKIEEFFTKAGFPDGVFQVLQGGGRVGEKMIEEGPDKVFFTGGIETGKKMMEKASDHLIPVELELGGNDAMIVFEDADIDRAVKGAVYGSLANAGQLCVAIERIYVQESIEKEFIQKVLEEINKIDIGTERDVEMGPMILEKQIDVVKDHVDDALEKGADLLTEMRSEDNFLHPIVLSQVTHDMKIMQEETFGPTVPIMSFKSEEEAVKLANDTQYGLNASVWTQNKRKAKRVVSKLETGNCYVNDAVKNVGSPYLPFGGVKNSGIGRYHGPEGLRSFTETRSVMINKNEGDELNWFPYHKELYDDIGDLIDAKHGDIGLLKKVKTFFRLWRKM